ncbi:MAG: hypothetical protein EZS28_000563 [Streblomastix strix]|uniref:Uncharacterized protein n=1 Tax=Streblomastix strix TaxID=222440 RepID=A0A5J4X9N1_9EUKA|nr:MAG: hypothetical protein EZS28_000563 [Streblomastix strix]
MPQSILSISALASCQAVLNRINHDPTQLAALKQVFLKCDNLDQYIQFRCFHIGGAGFQDVVYINQTCRYDVMMMFRCSRFGGAGTQMKLSKSAVFEGSQIFIRDQRT